MNLEHPKIKIIPLNLLNTESVTKTAKQYGGKIDLIINDILTSSKKSHADLHLGQLTFQRWNTCPKDKSKLNSIQLKGGTIKDFLK